MRSYASALLIFSTLCTFGCTNALIAVSTFASNNQNQPFNIVVGITGGTDSLPDSFLTALGSGVTVTWNSVPGVASYTVNIKDSTNTTVICSPVSVAAAAVNYNFGACALTNNTYYTANVTPIDQSGNSLSTSPFSFAVDTLTPGAFSIGGIMGGTDILSDNFLTSVTPSPIVSWGASTNASTYNVQIKDVSDLTTLCSAQNVSGWSTSMSGCFFVAGSTYHIHVQAISFAGAHQTLALNNSSFTFAQTGSWAVSQVQSAGAPAARNNHTAIWTGSKMIVWGGNSSGVSVATGGAYDPVANSWTPTAGSPLGARDSHTAVWTGSKMMIWGGYKSGGAWGDGALYDPSLNTWTTIATSGAPSARLGNSAVWTGSKVIIWGGDDGGTPIYTNTGAIYDPVGNSWTTMSTVGAPSARAYHIAAWDPVAGRMFVYGGMNGAPVSGGGVYDPVGNTWSTFTNTSPPTTRNSTSSIFDGTNLIFWGGNTGLSPYYNDCWSYATSANNNWVNCGTNGLGIRSGNTNLWTGTKMIIWGGADTNTSTYYNDGSAYNSATAQWEPLGTDNAPPIGAARTGHTAVWTGTQMIIWGGFVSGPTWLNNGWVYTP